MTNDDARQEAVALEAEFQGCTIEDLESEQQERNDFMLMVERHDFIKGIKL